MTAFVLLLASGVLAAGVFIAGKQAGSEQLSPLLILFWQISGGALVVWLVAWPSCRFPRWDATHLRYYLIGGLSGMSLPYVLAFIVLPELQVGTVGLLTALSPVMTYIMARLLGVERGHPLRLMGLLLGLAGVVLLVTPHNSFGQDSFVMPRDWRYMLLGLGIPLALAAGNIYRSRFWPAGSEAVPLVIGMLTVQAAVLFVVNLLVGNFEVANPPSRHTLSVLSLLGLLAGTSYLSSFRLLRVGGPVYLSQMGYVITAVTLLAGIVLWGERYGSQDLLSMGLILSGVLLTTLIRSGQTTDASAPAVTRR